MARTLIIETNPNIILALENGVLNIKVNTRMNSNSYNEFISLCNSINEQLTNLVIDMTNCESIDSFGLGALILLFDYSITKGLDMSLVNVPASMSKILSKAEFNKILEISYLP